MMEHRPERAGVGRQRPWCPEPTRSRQARSRFILGLCLTPDPVLFSLLPLRRTAAADLSTARDRMDNSLIIFLHGIGGYGRYFASVAKRWQQQWPSTHFALPDGPFFFTQGEGFQWFDIDDDTPTLRNARIVAARTSFDAIIQQALDRYQMTEHPERVALVGFSQGAVMALDTLTSDRCPYGAIVAFSGYLPVFTDAHIARRTPVALIHGMEDDKLPWQYSQQTERVLTQAGVDCELHLLPNVDHRVSVAGANLANDFLTRVMR
ncbi:alpha/beta hydrolase [Lonsdalea iberica]|nr:dienelactone hydrolase family protein [Lonsdalea iberica]